MLGHKSTSRGSAEASIRPQMRDYKPSDHPSFHRLPLKRRAFVKVTGEGGKKKKSFVILMPSIVSRKEAEQSEEGRQMRKGRGGAGVLGGEQGEQKEALRLRQRPSRWHLILSFAKKKKKREVVPIKRRLRHCPTFPCWPRAQARHM